MAAFYLHQRERIHASRSPRVRLNPLLFIVLMVVGLMAVAIGFR